MSQFTIRQRIMFSFAMIIAVMVLMGGLALQRLNHIKIEETALRSDSIPGLYSSGTIETEWHAYYSALHGLSAPAASDRAEAVASLRARHDAFEEAMGRYRATIHAADDRRSFEQFGRLAASVFALQPELIKAGETSDQALQQALRSRIAPTFRQSAEQIRSIIQYNYKQSVASGIRIDDAVKSAQFGIALAFAGALLLAVLAGFFLWRAITRPLDQLARASAVMAKGDFSQRLGFARSDEFGAVAQGYDRMSTDLSELVGQIQTSGIQVNSSINEITATLREQHATAAQIAATTTEIGATSREIAATSKELARAMRDVAGSAEQTADLAGDGQEGVAQMEDTMGRMIDATAAISSKLAVLAEKASNISQVVTTITKVADQTNLLSLNAAIEAEKAGEYGRGFSVVAVEIRRLVDQTAVATLDIEQMVREIQSAVSAGVMGMDKFSEEVRRGTGDVQKVGGQLSKVIEHVQAMVPRFETVNEGVQAQTAGAEQINLALAQLSEAAQQTVDALKQSNQAIDELHQVSAGLRDGVSKFKLLA
ncbi:methyl-accepting chemotaxis protein [Lysobacter sp. Root690]|uniref:methyl-accepting chemotaxis protein n=1 Tax=Lysobacter sp. Root690 TaxID=1736588 RepID=UPI0007021244|nr:methyl-accepting chemotaxis protein [Lysobacter sp. Root690]KRB04261.1 chemotaxis protein [Lysobacter sp. Root690]